MHMIRAENRPHDKIRLIKVQSNFVAHAAGSVLIEVGATKVLCSVSISSGVPLFLKNKQTGWLTAEYAMLPAATHTRNAREVSGCKRQGRSVEISRFVGRVFRSTIDLNCLSDLTVTIDCDVLQADGGTRSTAVIGTNLALLLAQQKMLESGLIDRPFIKEEVIVVSVGMINGTGFVDLDYAEDSIVQVDFNFALTRSGNLIEVHGTAEQAAIDWKTFENLHRLAQAGRRQIFEQIDLLKAQCGLN